MSSLPASVQLLCRQCSAPLSVETGAELVQCEYCGTTNYVDKSRTVLHFAVRQTVRDDDAVAALRRWMAGNDTVKGLDIKAQIEPARLEYFPMWLVRVRRNGDENILLEPAAALSISELKRLTIPASDLEPYDSAYDDAAVEATVPYDAMMGWLTKDHQVKASEVHEVALVHIPVFVFKYRFEGRDFTAVVDAASSQVFANLFPAKWEVPYLAIGGAAFVAYFIAAFVPLGSYLMGGFSALAVGVLIYLVAAVVLAVPIFLAAFVVTAKV